MSDNNLSKGTLVGWVILGLWTGIAGTALGAFVGFFLGLLLLSDQIVHTRHTGPFAMFVILSLYSPILGAVLGVVITYVRSGSLRRRLIAVLVGSVPVGVIFPTLVTAIWV